MTAAPAPLAPRAPAPNDVYLRSVLRRIDGRPYPAYNDILGKYAFPGFTLTVDHVQQDPLAPASRLSVRVELGGVGIPDDLLSPSIRRLAVADFIPRICARAIRELVGPDREPLLAVDHGEQEVLPRSSCVIGEDSIVVRFRVNLPSDGRSVVAGESVSILCDLLPAVVKSALSYESLSHQGIRRHVEDVEDQEALRAELAGRHLVAFIADGAILPRASGISQRPLTGPGVVPFQSPPELRVELSAPHRGKVTGMGIPAGVTLIVGGGFHGKSTLVNAIARGVYDQVPGDGRESVVTRGDAFVVRAEPGRPVERANIDAFISNLPFAKDTTSFTTDSASGSTSMAANIVEALEAGSGLLIIDEDTAASNFLVRDARMQRLVPDEAEPITPFVDLARVLHDEHRVSTIIAIGGSGDYFDVADTVIAMRDYLPRVVTEEARKIARELPSQRRREGRRRLGPVTRRSVVPESVDPQRRGRERVRARGREEIEFGSATIDVSSLDQLVDPGQTRAIADLLSYCWHRRFFEDEAGLADALARGLADAARRGLDTISPHGEAGDYAMPRLLEAVAALNRLRGLRVKQIGA